MTKYYFEVFEATLTKTHMEEMKRNLGNPTKNPDYRSRLVTPKEISDGKTLDGILIAENYLPLIGKGINPVTVKNS